MPWLCPPLTQTGAATDMRAMLCNAYAFNQPIGGWAVGRVQNFYCMLYCASSFDQDLAPWSVDPAARTYFMLLYATAFQRAHAPWAKQGMGVYGFRT